MISPFASFARIKVARPRIRYPISDAGPLISDYKTVIGVYADVKPKSYKILDIAVPILYILRKIDEMINFLRSNCVTWIPAFVGLFGRN
jgi:hypothetical protein